MVLNIKDWVQNQKNQLKAEVETWDAYKPQLLTLQKGDNPASNSYIKGKIKDAEEIGIETMLLKWNGEFQKVEKKLLIM